jgi:hypothetical protein
VQCMLVPCINDHRYSGEVRARVFASFARTVTGESEGATIASFAMGVNERGQCASVHGYVVSIHQCSSSGFCDNRNYDS